MSDGQSVTARAAAGHREGSTPETASAECRHWWHLDPRNYGVCVRCGAERQYPRKSYAMTGSRIPTDRYYPKYSTRADAARQEESCD